MRVTNSGRQDSTQCIEFSGIWHVLGPFQIGTREATWGVDPLEQYGGFATLQPDDKLYPSSLGINGEISWSTTKVDVPSIGPLHASPGDESELCMSVSFSLAFPDIHWSTSQAVYGWSALQWQAWVRGSLTVHGSVSQTVRLSLPGILEFDIDGERHFGGDFFAFNRAPLIQKLQPGVHTLNVRIIRDVRAMGAIGDPIFHTEVLAECVEPGLMVLANDILLPDFVVGHGFASNLCSIPVQNTGQDWLEVVSVDLGEDFADSSRELNPTSISVAPGQICAISAHFNLKSRTSQPKSITIRLKYRVRGFHSLITTKLFVISITSRQLSEPQKMVFDMPNGAASYCLIQAPCLKPVAGASSDDENGLPVMVVLHGAGVDVDGEETREMLNTIGKVRAWIVVPSGGSPWSGDDWHTWGLTDVQAAVKAIPRFIVNLNWTACSVDIRSIYVVGHSNGGQGTWHVLTHMPDRICAAAPVSGYSSIQKYVPYDYEREVDPRLQSVIQAALSSYRHEILINNAKGIPIQLQHGSADDNVPASHSRRMFQLLKEAGASPNYNEIPNKGHWYSGVMATPQLKDFYHRISQPKKHSTHLPQNFSIVVPSTGEILGSRGGLVVEQLLQLGQLGRVDIERRSEAHWHILTSNVRRLRLGHPDYTGSYPQSIRIDDDNVLVDNVSHNASVWLRLDSESHWKVDNGTFLSSPLERSRMQFGTINAILRQQISIMFSSELGYKIALQVSRNLRQYYSASCEIIEEPRQSPAKGNLILIKDGIPQVVANEQHTSRAAIDFPIEVCQHGIRVKQQSGREKVFQHCPGLGAIFLTPLQEESLRLVIWGYDKKGLEQAARVAPGLTGVGQPDFIVFGPESPWKGAAGALAMGFFEHDWSISASSYIT